MEGTEANGFTPILPRGPPRPPPPLPPIPIDAALPNGAIPAPAPTELNANGPLPLAPAPNGLDPIDEPLPLFTFARLGPDAGANSELPVPKAEAEPCEPPGAGPKPKLAVPALGTGAGAPKGLLPLFIVEEKGGAPNGLAAALLLPFVAEEKDGAPNGLATALVPGAPVEDDELKAANGLLIPPVVGAGRSTVNDASVCGADPNWG